ncbi:MAG: hypothetical protein Q9198_005240 [Flavoplaca austrocitrina]
MPEFAPLWHNAIMDLSEAFHFFAQFPWLEILLRQIPQPLVRKMMIREKVDQVQADVANNKKPDGQRTIFHDLFNNDTLIPEEKTPERLAAEGFSIVAAGSQTVAHTLAVISYHLIANPHILKRLQVELASAMPIDGSAPKWDRLEKLPFLGAIIQEGLRSVKFPSIPGEDLQTDSCIRLSCGVSHRLQRISPDIDLTFKASSQAHHPSEKRAKEWIIPKGTPVGMTSVLLHFNPSLFPDPHTFSPDRWLGSDTGYLRRFVVPFSKGSRQCLGMK